MTLTCTSAQSIQSKTPGVQAWISSLSLSPIGLTFTISAQLEGRGVRYYPSVLLLVNSERIEVGGSTSATSRHSMTQFMYLGDLSAVDNLGIEVYEAESMIPDAAKQLAFSDEVNLLL